MEDCGTVTNWKLYEPKKGENCVICFSNYPENSEEQNEEVNFKKKNSKTKFKLKFFHKLRNSKTLDSKPNFKNSNQKILKITKFQKIKISTLK